MAVTAKYTSQLVVMIEPSVRATMDVYAETDQRSLADVVRELLNEALDARLAKQIEDL